MIEWRAEIEKRQEAFLEDLKTMLRVESVRDDSQASAAAPFGPGPKEALETFLLIAKEAGFRTKNIDNVVGYAEIGPIDAPESVAVLAHVDVMPAGEGWESNPFEPIVKDGKVIARGASDDKGPGMAAFYGMKILNELNVPLKRRVRFIVGTDEENDWGDMDKYFSVEPQPTMGFSPDAEFPVINGEKGNVTYEVKFNGTNNGDFKLLSFTSGLRPNMVPGKAVALVQSPDASVMIEQFNEFLENQPQISGYFEPLPEGIQFVINGKQVHGASPEIGENAGTYLAKFLKEFAFVGQAKGYLDLLGGVLHDDALGQKLGVAHVDDVMGPLTMNIGIQKFEIDKPGFINLNFRYPKGVDYRVIGEMLHKQLTTLSAEVVLGGHHMAPHYVPSDDEIVKTLIDVYNHQTGLNGVAEVVGGGTYGRLMERGVAFGALFPGDEDTMHQANEFMTIDSLIKAAAIYGEAIERLATQG
ncbi:dipeptidase PepV [Periweissella beninensis]|uniref:dipeptidase PepV n=1 Tax=Periweissella beninensis TaxID=504936 RepID=UPI0021A73A88|nr:dipeptidase PepV [Periweissella beninensis]MCT4395591.1 dipeptidase PepV [Periweissella beninensis]